MFNTQTPQLLVVMTSFSKLEDAKQMARTLLEQHLVACVQINEDIYSLYRWEGNICEEREILLCAKTEASKWNEIHDLIKQAHPYDLPEILAFTPAQYDQHYSKWVQSEVNLKT